MRLRIERGDAAQEQEVLAAKLASAIVRPELMLWSYTKPAIILGCSQKRYQDDWKDVQVKRRSTLAVLCRRSGGGAVLAGPWMVSATLFVPATHPLFHLSLPAGFELFGRAWSRALMRLGVSNTLAQRDAFVQFNRRARAAALDWICFAGLSHGELLDSSGRKLLGLAQIRRKQCSALVSGLLLQPLPWGMLLSAHPQQQVRNTLRVSSGVLQQWIGSLQGRGSGVECELLNRLLLESLDDEIRALSSAAIAVDPAEKIRANA